MNSQLNEKWAMLYEKITELTYAGKLTWEQTDEIVYESIIGDKVIEVTKRLNSRSQGIDIIFRLRTPLGSVVDSFTDEDISNYAVYEDVKEFFEYLTRLASGADDFLNDLIKDLDAL